jgi:hypothetical protein
MAEDPNIARKLVEKDLTRLLERARAVGGKNFHSAGYDATSVGSTAELGDGEGAFVDLTIGVRGQLIRSFAKAAARSWREMVKRHPKALFRISIAGYDDDPRELCDFPEVREYVCRWARFAGITFETLSTVAFAEEESIGFLAACGVFGDQIEVVREPPAKPN